MTFARTVRLLLVFVLAAGVLTWQPSLLAQYRGDASAPYDPEFSEVPAYVSAIDGTARLERAGDVTSDFDQVPLEAGDHLSTTRGRVEVLYSDGSVVALDEYSAVTVENDATWRLHSGRVKVRLQSGELLFDAAPAGVARLREGGDYRITVTDNRRGEAEVELAVTRGAAELENRLGRTMVRAGTRALTTAAFAPSVPYAYASPRDEFERWTDSLEADRYGVESARYLPVELRAYGGDFDRYGSWSSYGSYGPVWYPRVSLGWQPYRTGRWSFVVNFGYNWIGGSRWEWPTHHYGRWERGGSRWFWVPQRPVRRIGYSAPRRAYNVPVNYYSRPVNSRPAQPIYRRANADARRPVDAPSRPPVVDTQRRAVPRDMPVAAPQNRQSGFPTRQLPSSDAPAQTERTRQGTSALPRIGGSARQAPPETRQAPQETRQHEIRPAPRETRQPPTEARQHEIRPAPRELRPAPQEPRQSRPEPLRARPEPRQAPPDAQPAPSNRPSQGIRSPQPQRSAPPTQSGSGSSPRIDSRAPSNRGGSANPQSGSGTATRRGRSGG